MTSRPGGMLACLAVCGCATAGTPAADYRSTRALADALGCQYQPFESLFGPKTEQGACEYAGAGLSLTTAPFADDLAEQIKKDPRAEGVAVLVGAGWLLLSEDEAALRQAQGVLGGDLR